MPEKVPLWVVQNTFATFGRRMIPYGELLPKDLKVCATCQEELYKVADWNWIRDKYYCNGCAPEARQLISIEWEREREIRKAAWINGQRNYRDEGVVHDARTLGFVPQPVLPASASVPMTEAQVPAGNMAEYMYQFWIGCLTSNVSVAVQAARSTCRACGQVVFGTMGRAIHKKESARFYTGGYSCAKVISMAICDLVHLHNCFICRAFTNKKHYGVPICSPNCHKVWRFAEKQTYPELDAAIAPFWLSTASIPVTGGSTTSESSSNKVTIFTPLGEEE